MIGNYVTMHFCSGFVNPLLHIYKTRLNTDWMKTESKLSADATYAVISRLKTKK